MSENKNWKEDMKSLIVETVEPMLDKKLSTWKPQTATSPPSSKPEPEHNHSHDHNHTLEGALDCPDCYPKLKDLVFKKEKERRDELPYVCETCQTGVSETEENCPTCGGTDARPRD